MAWVRSFGNNKILPKIELTYSNPSTYSTEPIVTGNSIVFNQSDFSTSLKNIYVEFSFICRSNVVVTFENALKLNGDNIVNKYSLINTNTSEEVYNGQGATSVSLTEGSYTVRVINLSSYGYEAGTNTITVL